MPHTVQQQGVPPYGTHYLRTPTGWTGNRPPLFVMRKKALDIVLRVLAVTLIVRVGLGKDLAAEPPRPDSGPMQYEEPTYLAGAIYAPGSKQLLFKFKRVANRSGSTLNVQRDFTYPDGTLAAREQVVYEGNALVRYELEEKQIYAGPKQAQVSGVEYLALSHRA